MTTAPSFAGPARFDRMAGPVGFPGPDAVVSIDPGKVLALAGGLAEAAARADGLAAVVAGHLADIGEDVTLVRALQAFAAWCDVERVAVRSAAEAIQLLDIGPVPAWLGGFEIRHAPPRPEFVTPGAAVDAAAAAAAAFRADDGDRFADLVERWSSDAVFVAVLVDSLGAAAIAAAIDHLAALTGSGLDDERHQQERVVADLAEVVATARSTQGSTLSVGDLVAAIPDRPPGEVALLFIGDTVFDRDFLVDAVDRLVEQPLGTVDDGVWVAAGAVDGERDARDSTTLVLQALARNPEASTRVLLDADLERLLVETPYRDGGATLAHVLDVATDPSLGDPDAPRAALHVITWVADQVVLGPVDLERGPHLAADTHAGLGRVAEHYIGSFRSDRLDDIVVDPVSDQLRREIGEEQADRFLAFTARQERAADDLRAALVRWAASGVGLVAGEAAVPLAPFTVIGDVGRRVSDAVDAAAVSWEASLDRRRDAEIGLWSLVAGSVGNVVNAIDPSNLVGSFAGSTVIDHFLPAGHAELDAAKRESRALSGDQLRLEQLALGELWARRDTNHLFEGVEPPPELLDGSRLRSLVEIERDDALSLFDGWLEQLAGHGVSIFDRMGAEFGSTGARSPD